MIDQFLNDLMDYFRLPVAILIVLIGGLLCFGLVLLWFLG